MHISKISDQFAVLAQPNLDDVAALAKAGYRTLICNRPDGEEAGQIPAAQMAKAAAAAGMAFVHIPVSSRNISPQQAKAMVAALAQHPAPHAAYCRSGARSEAMYKAAIAAAPTSSYDVVIVGGGSAGISCAASLLKRRRDISIAIIEPTEDHFYQPGWTLVGAGVFTPEQTRRKTADLIPHGADWIKDAVASFEPDTQQVRTKDGRLISYRGLIVAAGLTLHWDGIEGLREAVGSNGVTSNYRFDLAPYTRDLVRAMKGGTALFSQPPMPIKCAGAPQKAMYLSCHHWEEQGLLAQVHVEFHNAGAVLFGVPTYVPALEQYIARYGINTHFQSKLIAVDGAAKRAVFEQSADGRTQQVERRFDMLHAVPPQIAPAFVAQSPLADAAGFVAVDPATMVHPKWPNIFALGDVAGTSNAKTAAAVRQQAPVVAENMLAMLKGQGPVAAYDGYGSCPLTVERGKIVLAEFGYGGKLLPSLPKFLLDGTKPTRRAWILKDRLLPPIYWHGMLKGREWMAKPHRWSEAS
jgi:sulfide:quinone oxidoreductase